MPQPPRQKNRSPKIRRRRASTGERFGGISAPLSAQAPTSPRGSSPVSVCDAFSRSASFDEAFRTGTVIPYFLDSAFRSLEFDFADMALCSSLSSTKKNHNHPGCEILDDDKQEEPLSGPEPTKPETLQDEGLDSTNDCRRLCLPPVSSTSQDRTDLANPVPDGGPLEGNPSETPPGSNLPTPRPEPLEDHDATDQESCSTSTDKSVEFKESGNAPLHLKLLTTDDSSSSNSTTAASSKSSRSASGSNKGSSATPSKGAPAESAGASKRSNKSSGQELERVQVKHPGADRSALKELPALRDAPPAKREELFILKLKLCSVIFSFDDPMADKRGKDMKRQTLLELVDYVNTPAGQKIFTESVMGDLMAMVSANVCRALPPATDDFDPEEDEPVLEPAWPHLQVAYEFFLRFIVSSEVNAKAAKKYVDQKFCLQLVELFDSEDPRERDYLKTILHRIYGKFMSHRSFIRRAISNVFYRFVYETERHNGIGELLEILGSIINGFAIPLKKEHLQFLVRALIPLHKPKCVALYHQQLSYCIIQYVEKDADTATPILNGFFKCWPWSSSGKQVMFLNELEEILELLGADQLAQVSDMLFTNLARCLDSDHFQVVERALFLWNNEHLVNSGCLSRLNAQAVLPIIYGPLYKNSSGHWNATVEGLAQNVLKMYMEYDLVLYDRCTASYFRDEEEAKRKLQALEERWAAIENVASTSNPSILVK